MPIFPNPTIFFSTCIIIDQFIKRKGINLAHTIDGSQCAQKQTIVPVCVCVCFSFFHFFWGQMCVFFFLFFGVKCVCVSFERPQIYVYSEATICLFVIFTKWVLRFRANQLKCVPKQILGNSFIFLAR